MAQVTKNGKSSSSLSCGGVYRLKLIFRFLPPSLSSGFVSILDPLSPTVGRLSPPGGNGNYRDALAKTLFQRGPPGSISEYSGPTDPSSLMHYLQGTTSLETIPFPW